jgi:hypothetical protein
MTLPSYPSRHRVLDFRPVAACAVILLTASCDGFGPGRTEWDAGPLRISIDSHGRIVRMADTRSGRDVHADSVPSPLLSVQVDGVLHPPESFEWDRTDGSGILRYAGGVTAEVRVTQKPTHLVLELTTVEPLQSVEVVVWGPYATTIGDTIGETVGVVRDSVFAVGLQALNPKTLGGLPWRDNDFPPQIDIFESGDYSDLSEEGKRGVLYRVEAAKPEAFGSTLQAYTRDRSHARVIGNWDHDRYVAPPFDDGGVIGSKIALFGSPTADLLETIGAIEVAEGLPHPMIDGEWGKTARSASAAYLILDFGEADIDEAIAWTKRAGLRYLYHPEPFRTWGHFELNDRFPRGREGLRACVEKAEAAGIMVGVHTLSNFITTNDAYVTPVPDPRLARVGTSALTAHVDARQTEIPVESPKFFAQYRNNTLRTVAVGHELIQYRAVSEEAPWRLLDAKRGAFGTAASGHEAGDSVAMLADHGYRVFLTDADLGREVATTIADLFNETGLRQISFDGLEGNQSTGMGNYGEVLFTTTWYDRLSDDIRRHYIADASRTSHFFWHVYTRMNWGEPWYAGFRESQTEYRLKNQPYFRRNLMPGMLGWFQMTAQTSIEDVEWMLARSAAFDAGYAFVTSDDALRGNGFTDRILDAIGTWERARMAGAFSAEQKQAMEAVAREFHLGETGSDTWQLTEVFPRIVRQEAGARQPGAPLSSTLAFDNPGDPQELQWTLSAEGGTLSGCRLTLDDGPAIVVPVQLRQGWQLRYEGGHAATVRNADNVVSGTVSIRAGAFRIAPGRHTVTLACQPSADAGGRLEVRPRGRPSPL